MQQTRRIKYFLFGQHLADGIRVTITIILPALIGSLTGHFDTGITLAVGALCVSISDSPGPVKHKLNGMFYCLICVTLMALITQLVNDRNVLLGIVIMAATFFFSMLNVFGNRAAAVGSAALLIMILRISHVFPIEKALLETLIVFLGGLWYMLVALGFFILLPYRPVQRSLGNCLQETARYLEIKSELYNVNMDLSAAYSRLIDQQRVVNESQNEVRELLFKNRAILKESTYEGRILVVTFVASVDLFEQIMATWYDYRDLREKYKDLGVLDRISAMIKKLAAELSTIAVAIHSQTDFDPKMDLIGDLDKIKTETEHLLSGPLDFTLKKILINLRNLGQRIDRISDYFSSRNKKSELERFSKRDYARFVTHQRIDANLFISNLTLNSSAFRHALRMMITCTVGYILAKSLFTGHHSYWIIMTITIILKPAYSLTKSKNIDRLTGTIAGGIIGLLILTFVKNDNVIFGLLAFFMLGTYTFVRLNYVTMVVFLTPYVLILFHFLKLDIVNIAGERLVDTLIACVLSWFAIHFLFPRWESHTIKNFLCSVLQANIKYLKKVREIAANRETSSVEYKLVRKEVFVSTANLSAALHRMQSEPKNKQQNKSEIYELVVLNHVLSSNIASIADALISDKTIIPRGFFPKVKVSIDNLTESVKTIDPDFNPELSSVEYEQFPKENINPELFDQLSFIEKLSSNIKRISLRIENKS